MVTVDLYGRLGNNMFQYAMARLLAVKNNLYLETEWNRGDFLSTTEFNNNGEKVTGDPVVIKDGKDSPLKTDWTGKRVHLNGFFQDADFYNGFRHTIQEFWKLPKVAKNTEDIVIHLRLTDYYWNSSTGHNDCVIRQDWYENILKTEKYRRLYIVVEPHVTNKNYLDFFMKYKPIIVSGTPKSDFEFLMSFDRIVCSNSTFAWWAAFLSNASNIWMFKQWMGMNRTCQRLVNMAGAIQIEGKYLHNKRLGSLDWTGYWDKPDSFFNGRN